MSRIIQNMRTLMQLMLRKFQKYLVIIMVLWVCQIHCWINIIQNNLKFLEQMVFLKVQSNWALVELVKIGCKSTVPMVVQDTIQRI